MIKQNLIVLEENFTCDSFQATVFKAKCFSCDSFHATVFKASLTKWLSVCLRAKWFWVRVQLQSYIYRQQFLKPEHKLIYPHTGK